MPTSYGWYPVGERLLVAYEAAQGRRINAIGGYFSHGPQAGRFVFETRASLPKSQAKKRRKTDQEIARQQGLRLEEVGSLDAALLIGFIWRVAGRPVQAPIGWKRECPLHIVLDNYSVHHSQLVNEMLPVWEAAGIHVLYLPSYSPELSEIEPIWNDVKYRKMTKRSYETAGELKRAVDETLQAKADELLVAHAKLTTYSSRLLR